MRRKLALVVVITVGLLGLSLLPFGRQPAEAVETISAAGQLATLTNISRTSNGLKALLQDSRLATVGVSRSKDMIARDYFSHHIPPDDLTVVDLLESLGVSFRSAGENIAWNNAFDFSSVQSASTDFMNSPGHRKNLLDPRWDRLGAGVWQGGDKKMYTVIFLQLPDPTTAKRSTGQTGSVVVGNSGASTPPAATAAGDGSAFSYSSDQESLGSSGSSTAQSNAPALTHGELVEVATARTSLINNLVNGLLRLFLNL